MIIDRGDTAGKEGRNIQIQAQRGILSDKEENKGEEREEIEENKRYRIKV